MASRGDETETARDRAPAWDLAEIKPRPGGLALQQVDKVATIWLARPEKLNALTRDFWKSLRDILRELSESRSCGAIVIAAQGDRAFSAGGDIASFDALHTEEARRAFQIDCMETFVAVERCPLPVIAAVHGLALGGGCELALACDIVLAAEGASFGMPEANLGLVPGYGILRAPGVIGRQWTNWMVMGCERLSVEEARLVGLVQKIYPREQLLAEARALAQGIASRSREGIAVGKLLAAGYTSQEHVNASVETITRLHGLADGIEGRRAFLERRKPRFGAQ